MRLKTAEQYPLSYYIRCPAMIPGESGDSGHNPGLDGRGKIPVSSTIHERFLSGGKTWRLIWIQA